MGAIDKLKKTRQECQKCGGIGIIPTRTEDGIFLDDCDCVKYIVDKMRFVDACIPEQYWDFDIEDIDEEFRAENVKGLKVVHKYIETLNRQINEGNGLWFNSTPGLGKSIIIASILKRAVDRGFKAYFARASHVVTLKFDALRNKASLDEVEYIIHGTDIVAIEEIEKVYLASDDAMNNQLFYEFLSDIHDSKKAVLLSSNINIATVLRRFPTFVQDRLRKLRSVVFFGDSKRREEAACHV